MPTCPVCGTDIELLGDVVDGEVVSCPACGTRFYVKFTGNGVELVEMGEAEDYGE